MKSPLLRQWLSGRLTGQGRSPASCRLIVDAAHLLESDAVPAAATPEPGPGAS